MEKIKHFSLRVLVKRFAQSFKRFPVAMIFVLFLACFMFFLNHGGKVSARQEFFLIFYSATGALLAVALSLFTEDFKRCIVATVVQASVHALWLGVSIYLSGIDRFSVPQLIAVVATVVAIVLAIFFICFYRKDQDLPFWNFSIRMAVSIAVSVVIGMVLTLGLLLLAESFNLLFNISIGSMVYGDIWTVCMLLVAPILFMLLIPNGKNKYLTEAPEFSRFAKGVVQYLFLPLLGLYLITLYVYAAKILFQWSLPVGGVSYLVSGSMALMVLLIYLSYPLQRQEGNRLFQRVTRWLPVLMLPLLTLMTVAIVRRLTDYGITMSRLYLLVFNVWCYAVCLWLIFTRNKRIWLVPASFAVILFLISVGPQSIANITRRQLAKDTREALVSSGIKQFPVTGEQYDEWLKQVDPDVARSIDSKLHYMQQYYGFDSTHDLLAQDVVTGSMAIDVSGLSARSTHYYSTGLISGNTVPRGYSVMTYVEFDGGGSLAKGDDLLINVRCNAARGSHKGFSEDEQVEYKFVASPKLFAQYDRERNPQGNANPLTIDNGKAMLIINYYSLSIYIDEGYSINGNGLLFTR